MTTATAHATQVYSVFIRATPEQIWEAITTPEFTAKYFYGSEVVLVPEPGTPYRGFAPGRADAICRSALCMERLPA